MIIVGIHGVGSPQPGAVVSEIVDGFETGVFVEQGSTLRIEGQSYRQATIEGRGPETRIIEANWADLKHFPRGRLGRLLYVLKIFIAMWQISDAGWREESNGQAGPPGKALHFYLAAFGIVLPPVSIMIMFAFVLQAKTALAVIITIAIAVLLAGIVWWLSKFDRLIRAGLAVTAAGFAASSSGRLVPWLILLIGPLGVVTDIVADVLFYALPRDRNFKLSIADAAEKRFKTLLQQIPLADTIFVAYSQGTVVAHAVLREMEVGPPLFITAGSPLSSLYHRFLNIKPQALEGTSKWINFYRLSDYVAGKVEVSGVDNRVIESNYELGHFNYFEEADILDEVKKRMSSSANTGPGAEN
jgi:hypothetical protein